MDIDFTTTLCQEGVFAGFELWPRVLEFSSPNDICAFSQVCFPLFLQVFPSDLRVQCPISSCLTKVLASKLTILSSLSPLRSHQVCSRFDALVNVKNSDNEAMWRSLLKRDYDVTDSWLKRFGREDATFRLLYAAFCRSLVSPAGNVSVDLTHKHVRRSEKLRRWSKIHGLHPFYVAQLFHTSTQGQRTIVARYVSDETAHFSQVLEIRRCWNIQVEGAVRVWRAGYYRVVWRIKLAPDYEDIGPLTLLSKVSPSNPAKHLLTPMEADMESKRELSWTEDEIVNPLQLPGSFTRYVWQPPNPLPMMPPNVEDALHPNDRPFGAPEPEPRPQDDGFGFVVQQELFMLRNRIAAANGGGGGGGG